MKKDKTTTTETTTATTGEVLPVIPMSTYTGLNFQGEEVTVELPKGFTILGKVVEGNVSFQFPFTGNPDNKNRLGLIRNIQFKAILPQEIDIINQLKLSEKYYAIALMAKTQKLVKGVITEGKEVKAVSIMGYDGKCYGNMLDSASAIDVIGLLLHVTIWKQAHAQYLTLSGRKKQGTGSGTVQAIALESTDLLEY